MTAQLHLLGATARTAEEYIVSEGEDHVLLKGVADSLVQHIESLPESQRLGLQVSAKLRRLLGNTQLAARKTTTVRARMTKRGQVGRRHKETVERYVPTRRLVAWMALQIMARLRHKESMDELLAILRGLTEWGQAIREIEVGFDADRRPREGLEAPTTADLREPSDVTDGVRTAQYILWLAERPERLASFVARR